MLFLQTFFLAFRSIERECFITLNEVNLLSGHLKYENAAVVYRLPWCRVRFSSSEELHLTIELHGISAIAVV